MDGKYMGLGCSYMYLLDVMGGDMFLYLLCVCVSVCVCTCVCVGVKLA